MKPPVFENMHEAFAFLSECCQRRRLEFLVDYKNDIVRAGNISWNFSRTFDWDNLVKEMIGIGFENYGVKK